MYNQHNFVGIGFFCSISLAGYIASTPNCVLKDSEDLALLSPVVDCIAYHASSCLKITLKVLGHIDQICVLICADIVDSENLHLIFISRMIIHCHIVFLLQFDSMKQKFNGSFFLTKSLETANLISVLALRKSFQSFRESAGDLKPAFSLIELP